MATAKKTAAAEGKANPFEKLKSAKAAAAPSEEVDVDESAAPEEVVESDAEVKARLAEKRRARAAAAKAKKEAEAAESEEPEVDDEAVSEHLEEVVNDEPEEAEEAEEAPVKKPTRRTAKQVQEEADAKLEAMRQEMQALKAQLDGKANAADIEVLQDRVIVEGGVGGDVRVVGGGRTVTNNDWRATADGLRLIVGRASSQATQTLMIPVTLAESLSEVLAHVGEVTDIDTAAE